MKVAGPWTLVEDGTGAARALLGTDVQVISNRVAFIEKTPRIRIRPSQSSVDDWLNWASGPLRGDGPEDAEARQWCDDALRLFGYSIQDHP